MVCSNCGTEIPDKSIFCNICGAKILNEETNIKVNNEQEEVKLNENVLQDDKELSKITEAIVVSAVKTGSEKERKVNFFSKLRQACKKPKFIFGSIFVLLILTFSIAYQYIHYQNIQTQNRENAIKKENAIKTDIKNRLSEAENYAKNNDYYKASKTLLVVKDKYNTDNNSYDGLSKTVDEKRIEYNIKDYYTQAEKDIDKKDYSDLQTRVDYLVTFYADKKDIKDLCDRVVKIIEENKDNASLYLLMDKIQRTYPDNVTYKKVMDTLVTTGSSKSSTSTQASTSPAPSKPYEISNVHSENDKFGGRYAQGSIKNTSGHAFSYIQVNINLFDNDNNQVGSTIDNTTNLADGSTWIFKAPIIEEKTIKFKVVSVETH